MNDEWMKDEKFIVASTNPSNVAAAQNDNVLRFIDAIRREDRDMKGFTGSFQQYVGSLNSEISLEVNYNEKRQAMSDILLLSIDDMRESVKGVSEDEEAMNLTKYQKSYNAAARYMTALDEMLDLIVNRLGLVGR
jgi:flagellar hook-associated protein 1 FlgK